MLRNTALASQARAPRSQALHQQRSTQARGRTLHVCAAAHPQRRSRSPQDGLKKSSATKTGAASATAASPTAAARRSPPSSGAGEEEEDDDDEPMPAAYTLITDDPDQLAREIKSLQLENERTREALRAALAESEKSLSEVSSPSTPPPSSLTFPSNSHSSYSSPHSLSIEGARADEVDAELSWVLGSAPPSVAKPVTASFATLDESDSSGDEVELESKIEVPAPETPQAPPASPRASRTKVTDVVFVTAEAAPFSKTGGLGDVLGALPRAMAARAAEASAAEAEAASSSSSSSSSPARPQQRGLGGRVMVVLPRYMQGSAADDIYADAVDTGVTATLNLGNCGPQQVKFFHQRSEEDNVDWVFVDHPSYHRPGNPYGDAAGVFGDNQFRFSLLSLAALEAPLHLTDLGFGREFKSDDEKKSSAASSSSSSSSSESEIDANCRPFGSRPCTFVANDWHAGLVPLYLAHKFRPFGVYADARTLFVIHNLSHQGVEPAHTFDALGFPGETAWKAREHLHWEYPSWASITGDAVNVLKGAVLSCDRILTVSSGYAWEVQTPEGGWGLHDVLRSRSHVLNGVTNGINVGEWDPSRDAALPFNYSCADLSGKAKCKAALQEELGLKVDASVPLIGWIGRLDYQKGPDLLLAALGELVARNIQVVMLGSGSASLENDMRAAEARFPDHFRGWVGFSVPVSHRITAGSDIILMNSRFEPCGLNQLHAAAYGTPVVAHATGGLRDTILDAGRLGPGGNSDDDDELLKSVASTSGSSGSSSPSSTPSLTAEQVGTGWLFSPPETQPMLAAVDSAIHTWRTRPKRWAAMQRAAMGQDLSWAKAADEYATVIEWAHIDAPTVQ